MPKVAMIGAGSLVFCNNLIGDLLLYPELKDELVLSLMDIDAERLEMASGYARRRLECKGSRSRVEATLELEEALAGADYVINMVQVGGITSTLIDFQIPAKYGLKQTIADTHGIGGVFRGLRTIPVVLQICRAMEERCPEALLINYSNPMAMNVWAAYRAAPVRVVGLCHSIQLTAMFLANYAEIPYNELRYRAAGINHLCWFVELAHQGRDIYPRLRDMIEADPLLYSSDKVRFEIMKYFGCFVSESSEHMAEYVPYFIPYAELIAELNIPINEYIRRCEDLNELYIKNQKIAHGELPLPPHDPSYEYAPKIIHAMELNSPATIYGNVRNSGLIPNLPGDCCVEVPCLADRNGIQPVFSGELPLQLAALCRPHIAVQELTVRAALEGKREYVYYACQLDPLAGAVLKLSEIRTLADDLFDAHGEHLAYLK